MRAVADKPRHSGGIVLFDGDCALCNGWMRFLDRSGRRGRFRYAALQSDVGRRLLAAHGLPAGRLDTVVLIENGRAYARSTAVLRIIRRLRLPWSLLYGWIAIPAPLRDALYACLARTRVRQTCAPRAGAR